LEVDDAEATHPQPHRSIDVEPLRVGTAVDDPLAHPMQKGGIDGADVADHHTDPAHGKRKRVEDPSAAVKPREIPRSKKGPRARVGRNGEAVRFRARRFGLWESRLLTGQENGRHRRPFPGTAFAYRGAPRCHLHDEISGLRSTRSGRL